MTRRKLIGDSLTFLTAGALALDIIFVIAVIVLIAAKGLGHFWQKDLIELKLNDGRVYLGEIWNRESNPDAGTRVRLKVGNRDVSGTDFIWVDERQVEVQTIPVNAVLVERSEWGNFYGYPVAIRHGDRILAEGSAAVMRRFGSVHAEKSRQLQRIHEIEKDEIGDVNFQIEKLRLTLRRVELGGGDSAARAELESQLDAQQYRYDRLVTKLESLNAEFESERLVLETADGIERAIVLGHVIRLVQPNVLSAVDAIGLYASRIGEFLTAESRESNTEGGVFPAIFGTVMMVFIMSIVVVPFGVLAAIYLREYAKEGLAVRVVRIAVNNLAGVPSIVFGVFGLGFFVYLMGGSIDRLFYPESLPNPTFGTGGILWASLTLALLTVPVVIVATEEGLAAVPQAARQGSRALGATRFETLWRVVVPAAMPGILTGLILAMARAAGEVAPLMIVGMVKLAPTLPVDGNFPFVHLERKFMHLGFHIFDVGFQSPNVEAVKPMVFATALVLILVVLATNLIAILLRNRLRRKYAASAV